MPIEAEPQNHVEIPYRVVINEATNLPNIRWHRRHKYVNGVLAKFAAKTRATEPRRKEILTRN